MTGQLIKVRLVQFNGDEFVNLLVEYIDGTKQIVTRASWEALILIRNNQHKVKHDL